jgi:hypothetical protein
MFGRGGGMMPPGRGFPPGPFGKQDFLIGLLGAIRVADPEPHGCAVCRISI